MALTPVTFTWSAGPGSVQISGDWDDWKDKVELTKQADGSFSKEVSLPENKRIHYKYIVDGNWTTKQGDPTVDDNGNVNNITDVGPAPVAAKTESKPAETAAVAGAGVAAAAGGVAGGAALASKHGEADKPAQAPAAVQQQTPLTNLPGTAPAPAPETDDVQTPPVTAAEEKKLNPAQPIKSAAVSDIRNYLPHSLANASMAAVPILASTVATVTGADILRGQPEEVPVSAAGAHAVQAQSTAQPAAVGSAIVDPKQAKTDGSLAGVQAATKGAAAHGLDAPAVAVGDAGFAANVDPARMVAGKQGGEAAGAVASAGQSIVKTSTTKTATPSQSNGTAPTSKTSLPATPAAAPAAAPAKAPAQPQAAPSTPSQPKAAAAAAPAAAAPVAAAAPATPTKYNTVKQKKSTGHGLRGQGGSEGAATTSSDYGQDAQGGKRKTGFFGKIKQAFSPHSSPSK